MVNRDDTIDGLISSDEMKAVDTLVAAATSAIDAGKYHEALAGLRQALYLARALFGDNIELTELENTIAEINEML